LTVPPDAAEPTINFFGDSPPISDADEFQAALRKSLTQRGGNDSSVYPFLAATATLASDHRERLLRLSRHQSGMAPT